MTKKVTIPIYMLLAFLMVAQLAKADTIQVGYSGSPYGPWQTGSGGEFTLLVKSGLDGIPDSYSNLTKDIGVTGTFQTFCIEENEYIYPYNTIYNVSISDGAINGGVSGGNPDPISLGTAYLYSLFATGQLTGYNYTGDRNTSAAQLQNMIWWLEGEIGTDQSANPFAKLLTDQFVSLEAAQADNAGTYGVKVLNMTAQNGSPGQDQLVYVPEPGTLLFLGAGLLGLGFAIRRRKS